LDQILLVGVKNPTGYKNPLVYLHRSRHSSHADCSIVLRSGTVARQAEEQAVGVFPRLDDNPFENNIVDHGSLR